MSRNKDLSQLEAVYPRWQSFLANTSQQFFGTVDFDTARYLSGALGQQTIRYETQNVSQSSGTWGKPGSSSSGTGEHLQGRSLLTPDELMRPRSYPADRAGLRRAALLA